MVTDARVHSDERPFFVRRVMGFALSLRLEQTDMSGGLVLGAGALSTLPYKQAHSGCTHGATAAELLRYWWPEVAIRIYQQVEWPIGAKLKAILARSLLLDPTLVTSCLGNLGSEDTTGPNDAQLEKVRAKVSEFLLPTGGLQDVVTQAEVDADLLTAWAKLASRTSFLPWFDSYMINYRDVDGDGHAQQEIDRPVNAGYGPVT
eukprot:3968517-Amphidinium_carterae.2